MANYWWKALDEKGFINYGLIASQNRKLAEQKLADRKMTIIAIKQQFFVKSSMQNLLFSFTKELVLLLKANITLEKALIILEDSEKNVLLKAIFSELRQKLQSGLSLSESLCFIAEFCPDYYRVFIKTGEETGKLSQSLQQLFNLLKHKRDTRSQLKKALAYPSFLLVTTLLISSGIIFFVIPSYQNFFTSMGSRLPKLTQYVLDASFYLRNHLVIISMSFSPGIIILLFSSKKYRYIMDKFSLKLPWISNLITDNNLSRWSYLLAISLKTGIPMLQAIKLANRTMTNQRLRQQFDRLIPQLAQGKSLHKSLQSLEIMQPGLLQLVLIGENSGTIAELISEVAKIYQSQLGESLAKLTRRAEPAAILLLAAIVGLVIAALYLPMVNLGLTGS